MCKPILVGGRAYPLRRIVDLRHEPIDIGRGPDWMLDRATEVLSCGHTGHTYIVTYPAEFVEGDARRCRLCATPEQRARAGQKARSRW
jgi:hypothetical protein